MKFTPYGRAIILSKEMREARALWLTSHSEKEKTFAKDCIDRATAFERNGPQVFKKVKQAPASIRDLIDLRNKAKKRRESA